MNIFVEFQMQWWWKVRKSLLTITIKSVSNLIFWQMRAGG